MLPYMRVIPCAATSSFKASLGPDRHYCAVPAAHDFASDRTHPSVQVAASQYVRPPNVHKSVLCGCRLTRAFTAPTTPQPTYLAHLLTGEFRALTISTGLNPVFEWYRSLAEFIRTRFRPRKAFRNQNILAARTNTVESQ